MGVLVAALDAIQLEGAEEGDAEGNGDGLPLDPGLAEGGSEARAKRVSLVEGPRGGEVACGGDEWESAPGGGADEVAGAGSHVYCMVRAGVRERVYVARVQWRGCKG